MATQQDHPNESAATCQWLVTQLGLDKNNETSPVRSAWNEVRTKMYQQSTNSPLILESVDWVSDFWVARGAVSAWPLNNLAPTWMPPDEIDQWPVFDVEEVIPSLSDRANRSNHDVFIRTIQATAEPVNPDDSAVDALEQYLTLKSALVPRVFDVPAIKTEHVRVWLAASLGHLLMFAPLELPGNLEGVAREVVRRLGIPVQLGRQQGMVDLIGDRHLETLYNARMIAADRVQLGAVRIGQGEEWRDHWQALSFEISAQDTLDALRMAAKLMRCSALIVGLGLALASKEDELRTLAVAVIRRWLLTVQAMAWLEIALQSTWVDIRPKDLCSFALNATKPDWPRRVVAVSHRSKDVKPELREMQAWRAGRFAIDANYAPSWETNIGMIWGLFAPTPAITRVHSPAYRDSEWCRRELELTDYVLKESDFLGGRWIVDLDQSEVRRLDAIVEVWKNHNPQESFGTLPEFPPITEVCSPSPMPEWEARMLRASAALRMIHAFLSTGTPDLVNKLALLLKTGTDLPGVAPTNNPDGWRAYGQIFREAGDMIGAAPNELAVRLPDSYNQSDREIDLEIGQRVPDLQTGSPSLRDVLVAMEWLRVEFPQYIERKRGDFMAINCQRLSREVWENNEEVSLHRGLAAMRTRLSVPLWIIQMADQDVEHWPLIGEVPIFTEHLEAQFGWMLEASFDRRESQQRYPADSGMILAPALAEKCSDGSA
jgi:hypothetical protein